MNRLMIASAGAASRCGTSVSAGGVVRCHLSRGHRQNREIAQVGDRQMRRRRTAISRKTDLHRHQILCDRRTHRLSAVGFRDLPRVEDDGHQRAITLLRGLVPEPRRPANITLGTACLSRGLIGSNQD
jgi:hypothetical protein